MLPKLPVGTQMLIGSSVRDRARREQIAVRGEIVDDLRHKATPVDGVGAAEHDAPIGERLRGLAVGEDALHAGLRVVKVAVHGA